MNISNLGERNCRYRLCKTVFKPEACAQQYCSDQCRTDEVNARRRVKPEHWSNQQRKCHYSKCGKTFDFTATMGANTQHCSPECSRKCARRSTEAFYQRNPGKMSDYNKTRGRDTLTIRLHKKYPDLPKVCEAVECSEDRVLEAAHRPEYKRNGAWRVMKHYARYMFWMLCPTHHKLVDLHICTPDELGLSPAYVEGT